MHKSSKRPSLRCAAAKQPTREVKISPARAIPSESAELFQPRRQQSNRDSRAVQNINHPGDKCELYRSFAANESNFMGSLFKDCFQPATQLIPTNGLLIDPELAVGLDLHHDDHAFGFYGPIDRRLLHDPVRALLLGSLGPKVKH